MQLHAEGCAELRHRARQDHGPARRMLLQHLEPVGLREGAHLGEIRRIRAVLAREVFPAQVRDFLARDDRGEARLHRLLAAPTHQHTHFQPLGRIGGRHHPCAGDCGTLAAFQQYFRHGRLLMLSVRVYPLRRGRAAVADRRIRMRAVPGQVSWVRAPRRPAVRLPAAPAAAPARRSSSPRSCA